MDRLENVLEDPAQINPCDLVRIDRHCSVAEIQGTNIVKSENVIDMTVGNKDGVEITNVCAQGLLSKVRRRIYENRLAIVFDEDRNSKAFVTRICG